MRTIKIKFKKLNNYYIYNIIRFIWLIISFPSRYFRKNRRIKIVSKLFNYNDYTNVIYGPFSGMKYMVNINDRYILPKLIGSYESYLHNEIYKLLQRDYDVIINIGAADGYYAVGFSNKITNAIVYAYELNPKLREMCFQLVKLNNLSDKVKVLEKYDVNILKEYSDKKILLICDIDGGEAKIFSEDTVDDYKNCDILVEFHDHYVPSISKIIHSHFYDSHICKIIKFNMPKRNEYPLLNILKDEEIYFSLDEEREDLNQVWGVFLNRQ